MLHLPIRLPCFVLRFAGVQMSTRSDLKVKKPAKQVTRQFAGMSGFGAYVQSHASNALIAHRKNGYRSRMFEHQVIVCPTSFRSVYEPEEDAHLTFQGLLKELIEDEARNRLIGDDIARAV